VKETGEGVEPGGMESLPEGGKKMGRRRILRWQYVGEIFCNLIFCSRKRRKEAEGTMEDAVTSVCPPPPQIKRTVPM